MSNKTVLGSNRRRVIVADPRSFMRGCLACWLNEFGSDFQPAVTDDAVEALEKEPLPGAVILSASSRPEGRAWLEKQAAGLRDAVPELPIVLILGEADMAASQETALSLGLQGFIPMSSSLEIAVAALRLVIAGGCYYPHVAAAGPSRPITNIGPLQPRPPRKLHLTPREQAVFELLSQGLPNKLIARQLGMALSTVKIHVHHIIEKLNVQNRTEVALWGRVASSSITEKAAERPVLRQLLVHEMR
jgi:two-component system nitrate/nitrite response regulator NarL